MISRSCRPPGEIRLRRAIADQVFTHRFFERLASERLASMPNPPFHIIVHNSVVSLVGVVQSQIERIEMERIAGQTQGVLRVENRLVTRTGR